MSVLFLVVFVVWAWFMISTVIAHRQRMAMINAKYSTRAMSDQYWSVGFSNPSHILHVWYVFTFRDPWVLYPPEVAEAAKRGAKPHWETSS